MQLNVPRPLGRFNLSQNTVTQITNDANLRGSVLIVQTEDNPVYIGDSTMSLSPSVSGVLGIATTSQPFILQLGYPNELRPAQFRIGTTNAGGARAVVGVLEPSGALL
jgi:hypothetical protein